MEKQGAKYELITGFWKLYEQKPLEKISIRELCSVTGYNRSTFYAYYNNIYELLDAAVDELFIPVKNDLLTNHNAKEIFSGNLMKEVFIKHFAAKNSYLELIIKRNHVHLLTTRLKDELVKSFMTVANNTKKEEIEFILEYHVSAVFGILGHWIRNDRNIPEQILLERVYSISKEGTFPTILKQIDGDRNML